MKKSNDLKDQLVKHFAEKSNAAVQRTGNMVCSYNRVSSKEQMEKGNSLEWQQEHIERYAQRTGLIIKKKYGGTYESAKTDDRTEFKKMIADIKRDTSITALLVYSYDRFSRSGLSGLNQAHALRKIGVNIIAVTQPVETSSSAGVFQENLQLLFSKWDNDQRRDKSTAGTKSMLQKGYWPHGTPMGYTNKRKHETADRHELVINEEGILLRQAFKWKASDKYSNQQIVDMLKAKGLHRITLKNLAWIFRNVFYCGYLRSGLLPGQLIEGKHPALIDEATFLKVNKIDCADPRSGIPHQSRIDELPLKVFAKEEYSGSPFTGYYKKDKNKFYYKARDKGAKTNVSAQKLNSHFEKLLLAFEFNKILKDDLKSSLLKKLTDRFRDQIEVIKTNKSRMTELTNQIEGMEERFVLGEITREQWRKYSEKLSYQKELLLREIEDNEKISSNLEKVVEKGLQIAENLQQEWISSSFDNKVKLQYLVFPEGITYNKENDSVRTKRVNSIFAEIPVQTGASTKKQDENSDKNDHPASYVGMAGFEPATSWSQTRRDTGLRYIPRVCFGKLDKNF